MNNNVKIPAFKNYFPSYNDLDKKQLNFYQYLTKQLKKGEYVKVEGNVSYVYMFIYELINNANLKSYSSLHSFLIYLSELYSEENSLKSNCRCWANDCLLVQNKLELFLEKSESNNPFITSTHHSNLRLNIQRKVGIEPSPLDMIAMFGGRKSKVIVNNQGLYKDCIVNIFNNYSSDKGGWNSIFDEYFYNKISYEHYLFGGVPISRLIKLSFPIVAFYTGSTLVDDIKDLVKEAENLTRDILGIPKIGQGWISETTLFKLIESHFPQINVIQHGTPCWLGRQHFDIWIPDLKIAIEYHGIQHFQPVDFFGGKESYDKTIVRDKRKENLAKRHGVKLFIIKEEDSTEELISHIQHILHQRIITMLT